METEIRLLIPTEEFNDFYERLSDRVKSKYDYVMSIMATQYVVSEKFVKHLEGTHLYEMRVSISSNEYRTVIFAIDGDNFMSSKRIVLLGSFLKKDTKQYKIEINKSSQILDKWRKIYVEDK